MDEFQVLVLLELEVQEALALQTRKTANNEEAEALTQ